MMRGGRGIQGDGVAREVGCKWEGAGDYRVPDAGALASLRWTDEGVRPYTSMGGYAGDGPRISRTLRERLCRVKGFCRKDLAAPAVAVEKSSCPYPER